jgi:hypothetical protein
MVLCASSYTTRGAKARLPEYLPSTAPNSDADFLDTQWEVSMIRHRCRNLVLVHGLGTQKGQVSRDRMNGRLCSSAK